MEHSRHAKQHRKGLDSLFMLITWKVWKECNSCVQPGVSLWQHAAAKSLVLQQQLELPNQSQLICLAVPLSGVKFLFMIHQTLYGAQLRECKLAYLLLVTTCWCNDLVNSRRFLALQ
ncbi:unnamed protein product [Urochloa humidicola]